MNCKPGDLAVIVKAVRPSEVWGIGKIVKCISAFEDSGWACWIVEPAMGAGIPGVCDLVLRPIRDPGDDAIDESRAWLPPVPYGYPTKETA